ncbi:hypothetical protein OIDMADRAFT_109346 [Oidiodendron maius Zn]|uniref:Uncharacterized protein n=1 Tax=Oidiodendron maius (strain Zn) TaxID=913774 RepID=A0A0C3D8U5_OIDMZ|nr:hypothetical protein OIDMADRAFT_109346 [Oidiodendron maius Zn]
MSVFSKIRHSRKAAKEHKVKAAEKEAAATVLPYKHVPTHAAIDALNGAPSSWKSEDLSKIKEHHKRRSQMVISRTHSTLSTTSYMNAAAGPSTQGPPPLPQAYTYNNHNSTWFNRDGDLYYAGDSAQRRVKPSRHLSYQDSALGPSPLATEVPSEGTLPLDPLSSGNSTTSVSSENLEMSNSKMQPSRPQPVVYAENDFLGQLHTSTTRKLGEAPISSSPLVATKPALRVVVQDGKPVKPRWSLMGKKNAATITV